MDDSELDDLWQEVVEGSEAAFVAVYDALGPPVRAYAARIGPSSALAEEVVQETFLRALRRARQYRGPRRLRSWLFAIAQRATMDALAGESKAAPEPPVQAENSVTDSVLETEGREVLDAAIRELPVAERSVLLMRVYLGLPYREIAEIAGVPMNTALSRMHRALRRLRSNVSLRRYFL